MRYKVAGRASIFGAFFFCTAAFAAPPAPTTNCLPEDKIGEKIDWHSVSYIYDGDTIRLANGDKIRFIGINTPETAKKDRPAEPFADQALKAVQQAIKSGKGKIGLIPGKQSQDRYGRLLAHIFLHSPKNALPQNLTRKLLSEGLGSQVIIPPNLGFQDCYQKAQHQARSDKKGLWSLPGQGVIPTHRLQPTSSGFRHIVGKVTRIGNSRYNIWLNFDHYLAIKIARKDLGFFRQWHPKSLLNKTIEASGWIYTRNHEKRMQVHHPKMIRIIQ